MVQYFRALGMGGIVSIFTHLDRFYIKAKLDLDLKKQLIMIFSDLVTDPHMARLIRKIAVQIIRLSILNPSPDGDSPGPALLHPPCCNVHHVQTPLPGLVFDHLPTWS